MGSSRIAGEESCPLFGRAAERHGAQPCCGQWDSWELMGHRWEAEQHGWHYCRCWLLITWARQNTEIPPHISRRSLTWFTGTWSSHGPWTTLLSLTRETEVGTSALITTSETGDWGAKGRPSAQHGKLQTWENWLGCHGQGRHSCNVHDKVDHRIPVRRIKARRKIKNVLEWFMGFCKNSSSSNRKTKAPLPNQQGICWEKIQKRPRYSLSPLLLLLPQRAAPRNPGCQSTENCLKCQSGWGISNQRHWKPGLVRPWAARHLFQFSLLWGKEAGLHDHQRSI